MSILLVDCDEVLSRFREGVNRYLEDHFELADGFFDRIQPKNTWDMFEHLDPLHRNAARAAIESKGFCDSLRPFAWQKSALKQLSIKHSVFVVTAAWTTSQYWHAERLSWLYEHFDIPASNVVFASHKYLVKGDIFIDDNPTHVIEWALAHPDGKAYLHSNATNGYAKTSRYFKRINRLSELL